MDSIRRYIEENPARWLSDPENPTRFDPPIPTMKYKNITPAGVGFIKPFINPDSLNPIRQTLIHQILTLW